MILDYKIDDKWAKGLMKPENDDEYIFVFYVPDCTVNLKNDVSAGEFAGKAFGEYLRKSEKSDHMDWTDPSSFTLIANIKNQVCNKVNAALRGSGEGRLKVLPASFRENWVSAFSLQPDLGKSLSPTVPVVPAVVAEAAQ